MIPIARGIIHTICYTPTHRLLQSTIYTPHAIITNTTWKIRRN